MAEGFRDWLRSVKESLGHVFDEVRQVGSNFVGWCVDAPVVVSVLVGSTGVLLGWLHVASYSTDPKPWVRGTGVLLQLVGFTLAAYGLERTLEKFGQVPSTSRIFPWLRGFWEVFDTTGNTYQIHPDDMTSAYRMEEGKVISIPQTLEERVEKLEKQLASVKDEVEEVSHRLNDEVDRLEGVIEAVEEKAQEEREKLVEAEVGEEARWVEWGAIFSFIYGVPLASFPFFFLPAHRILAVPLVAGTLLGSLHWFAD
ncbi:tropomyosin [Salinibacter sp.]|uniref:tropomyosin n=1 Tax=Salinibacter sp. TaxID=2065818 RepID=UPI0021E6D798|nr:tropomyosin [Salinibacter sp.]